MPTVDTNVLLRWVLNDVPDLAAAADALLDSGVRCFVPDAALIETVYVLERVMRLTRPLIVQSVESVLGLSSLSVNRQLWRAVLDEYSAHPKLSITDVFLTLQAEAAHQLPLYTFDKKLARQQAGAQLLV